MKNPIEGLKQKARSLGHRFEGDPDTGSPASTPPNSVAEKSYKASVKNIHQLPQRHMKLRQIRFFEAGDGDSVESSGDTAS